MNTLTWEEAAEWTKRVGIRASVERMAHEFVGEDGKKTQHSTVAKNIRYADERSELRITLPLPKLPYQVAYLANALLPHSEDAAFQPCLLWITDWGIWSDVSERVVESLVESFRENRGELKPLIETPAHLFGCDELVDAQALLTLAVVFGWDCYVIPEHGNYYAFTSHDEYLQVVAATSDDYGVLKRDFEQWTS
jgi:hypothetical protein